MERPKPDSGYIRCNCNNDFLINLGRCPFCKKFTVVQLGLPDYFENELEKRIAEERAKWEAEKK